MMRLNFIVVLGVVFLLSGIVFPFAASNYFYATEGNVTVTSEDFTSNGTSYSIIYFNGAPTFLLKNGNIVNDSSEISTVVYNYYAERYYPTQQELNELSELIKKYNESRNNGYDWKNMEEYKCREVLFTDKRVDINGEKLWCHDDASCDMNAKLLYQAYSDALGLGSYQPLLEPLKQFSYASYGTDSILQNISRMLENADRSTIVETVDYIKTSIPTLRRYANDIESTVFRTPRLNDSADRSACQLRCYALCPSFDLDQDTLAELETKADALSEKVRPLASYLQTSSSIYNNTMARLGHFQNQTKASYYNTLFEPIESEGLAVESYARNVSTFVTNTSFNMKIERLSELRTKIRTGIDSRNFTGLDADIEEYSALVSNVRQSAVSMYQIYNETLAAKNYAEMIFFEISTKDLGPIESEKLTSIKENFAELNERFGKGLSPAEYEELKANYTSIAEEEQALLGTAESGSMSKVMLYFRGFARKVNNGIAELATRTNITNVKEIPENKYIAFGGFSLLVFLSLTAILFLLFLYFIKICNYSKMKYVVIAGFLLGAIVVAIFSGMLFVMMQKTSTQATLDEFLVDLNERQNVAVVVDTALATETQKTAMESCGAAVAKSIAENNKTVVVYNLGATGNCIKTSGSTTSSTTLDACLREIDAMDSVIYLNPSGTLEVPKLYTAYFNKAEIYAPSDYYTACPLSTIFR